MLLILLQNLVGNAFSYTQTGYINIGYRDHIIEVVNSNEAAFLRDAREAPHGSGLGLSIVQRLCDRHGIKASLSTGDMETRATLEFPACP